MEKFFGLKQHGTTYMTEIMAGLTTFFAMAYIIFVNPSILSMAGTKENPMPMGAVFLATIIASAIGTFMMGLFANVPYAQAPGMGLNAFFTFTVCHSLGFSWQQALAMVFICGMLNLMITVTNIRKQILRAIPECLQSAIGGGIGMFIAFIGIKNAGLLQFTADPGNYVQTKTGTVIANSSIVPALVPFRDKGVWLAIIGLVLTIVLLIWQVKGAIMISILGTTLIGIPLGVVSFHHIGQTTNLATSFRELGQTFGVAFGEKGLLSLFADTSKIPLVLMTIFAFALSDTFDTLGTFLGTGKRAGIFSEEDKKALENGKGFHSKMERALVSDFVATSVGAVFGTSNVTTYVESAAGIGAGGRTGLTSVVTGICFLLSVFLAPIIGIVPTQATAPVLILVGVMMMSSFREIQWGSLEEAIPAFFASVFMAFCYSISYGIAAGFITYCLVKTCKGKGKEVHPILWIVSVLFVVNFIVLATI